MENSNPIQNCGQNAPGNQYNYWWPQTEQPSRPPFNAWNSQPPAPVQSTSASNVRWQPTWSPYDNYQHLASSQQNGRPVSTYQTNRPHNYAQEPAFHRQFYDGAALANPHAFQSRPMQTYADSWNCSYPSFERPDDDDEPDAKTQRQKDQEWLNDFLAKCRTSTESARGTKSKLNISASWKIITDCLTLCGALRTAHSKLRDALEVDKELWTKMSEEAIVIMENLQASLSRMTPSEVRSLKIYIKKRHSKRQRQKRQKKANHERKRLLEQQTKNAHEKIDTWQETIRQTHLAAEMERKLKKEADSILSEVRKKRAEANKTLDLVKSVTKLRVLKKQAAENKGLYTSLESDRKFSKETSQLEDVLKARLTEYGEEERTLQVMLDEEHQVTRESVAKQRQRQQMEKIEALKQEKAFCFFGSKDIDNELDPRFPYWKYHTDAERDVDTLIRLRQSWDIWLAPPETAHSSGIPLAWVTPAKPSSEEWASYLDRGSVS